MWRVLGLMSGTSFDAVDVAAADLSFDGDTLLLRPLGSFDAPLADDLRAAIASALPPAATTMGEVCRLDTVLGQAFAEAARAGGDRLCGGNADLVASHGQTVFHWVEQDAVLGTLQLGQPAWIAEATGLPVVADFRPRDVAAGGQGAPLVSTLDALLLSGRPGVPAALNLGGIANVTVVPSGREPLAFDTGPANALTDAAVGHYTGGARSHDAGGAMAARGRVVPELLDRFLAEPYYRREAPKSTGKELFHLRYLLDTMAGLGALTPDDVVATTTRLTARTVADALRPFGATEVIASGGGTRNPTLMAALREELGDVRVATSDEVGLPSDGKEAYAFAVLGFLTAHGVPATVPSCTGARHASVLGSITPGAAPLRFPEPPERAPARLRLEPPR